MAKKSAIQKNLKRIKLAKKFAKKTKSHVYPFLVMLEMKVG